MKLEVYDSEGRRKYLTKSEGLRFLESCPTTMSKASKAFCQTLYFTGCRISEALPLSVDNIDFEENMLQIRTLKKRSVVSTRRVPIPSNLTKILIEIAGDNSNIWSFSRTTAWREIKSVMKESRIEGIHACPKGLRHGFGVRCAMAGIPVTKIQKWMGHSNVETTAIYLDVQGAEDRELMRRTWNEKP